MARLNDKLTRDFTGDEKEDHFGMGVGLPTQLAGEGYAVLLLSRRMAADQEVWFSVVTAVALAG